VTRTVTDPGTLTFFVSRYRDDVQIARRLVL
jgi:hypothetical protein